MTWRDRLNEGYALFDVRLFDIGTSSVTLATLTSFVLVVVFTLWLASFTQKTMIRALSRQGGDEGTIAATARLGRYIVQIVGLAVAVHNLGINLTALFTAGAVFAVAIGFAMQNITQNFVSGVILLAERAIKPGDVLEVAGRMVQVRHMGIRATVARTLDEEDILIPNSQLVAEPVKNYTFRDSLYRLRISVGVTYSSDMAAVKRVLETAASGLGWISSEREPRIFLTEFGASSVNWEVSVWIENPWLVNQRRSALNQTIWFALQDAGITIAFPQLDVHFDPPVAKAPESLRAAG